MCCCSAGWDLAALQQGSSESNLQVTMQPSTSVKAIIPQPERAARVQHIASWLCNGGMHFTLVPQSQMGTGIMSATKSFSFSPQMPLGGNGGEKHKYLLEARGHCVIAAAVSTEGGPVPMCLLPLRSLVVY